MELGSDGSGFFSFLIPSKSTDCQTWATDLQGRPDRLIVLYRQADLALVWIQQINGYRPYKTATGYQRTMKKYIHAVLSNPETLFLLDRALLSITPKKRSTHEHHILVAAPGAGNIGDQAMAESFIENTPGKITIITRNQDDIVIPKQHASRAKTTPLKSLIYGAFPFHVKDTIKLGRLLQSASSLTITGADIMDGAYNWRASVNRANIACLASNAGVPTKILGFSWNGRANEKAKLALRRASHAGVILLLRDPISAERARADGLHNIVEASDSVFSATNIDFEFAKKIISRLPPQKPYVLINASGLIESAESQTKEYLTIINEIRDLGFNIILLPHVSRPGGDDILVCKKIYQALQDPSSVFLVDSLLQPSEIRGLTKNAALVITGRMHLAIMSLYNSVPAITLATQGKVEGLMRLFETPQLCLNPSSGFGDKVVEIAASIFSSREDIQKKLQETLPAVRELSLRNFSAQK